MSVVLPVAEIARLYDHGERVAAIAKRFRVSSPTILSRLRMYRGEKAWRRPRTKEWPDAETFWPARLGDRRFNSPLSTDDAMVLRRLAGWLDR